MTMYRDTQASQMQEQPVVYGKKRNWLATMLLCAFIGPFGIHRFYTGYPIIGIIQLLTFGGCCIWMLIDYIMIALNKYRDKDENELSEYNGTVGFIFLILLVVGIIIGIMSPSK